MNLQEYRGDINNYGLFKEEVGLAVEDYTQIFPDYVHNSYDEVLERVITFTLGWLRNATKHNTDLEYNQPSLEVEAEEQLKNCIGREINLCMEYNQEDMFEFRDWKIIKG